MHRLLLLISLFILSCGASSPLLEEGSSNNDSGSSSVIPDNDNSDENNNANASNTSPRNSDVFSLDNYRTKLSDRYSSYQNDIPESFLILDEEEVEEEKDLFEGYRIQIFSGQFVDQADSVASQFRIWADTTIAGYQPETYVFFRPPYYRVHVGDFHTQERANTYAQLVKRRFREAWVVYDRVDPWNVPADTVRFTLIKN